MHHGEDEGRVAWFVEDKEVSDASLEFEDGGAKNRILDGRKVPCSRQHEGADAGPWRLPPVHWLARSLSIHRVVLR
jgi:hypothetical protein